MKNRKFWISVISGVMAAVMLLGLVLSILPPVSAKSSSEIRQEISALEDHQRQLQEQCADLQSRQIENWETTEQMVEEKNNIDQQIGLLHGQIDALNEQTLRYSMLIAENQVRLDEAQQALEQLSSENRARVQAMEEESELSIWSVIFRSSSFAELLDRVSLIREVQRSDQQRLDELSEAAQEVASAQQALTGEKQELEQSRQELDQTQLELEEKRAEADAILEELIRKQGELVQMHEQYLANAQALVDQIAQAEQAYNEAKEQEAKPKPTEPEQTEPDGSPDPADPTEPEQTEPEKPDYEGWTRPCSWARLSCPYGWRIHPITGKKSFHSGVDLANDQGTPIYAARSGTVTAATYNEIFGNYVTINHGDGFSSLYGHMTNSVVSSGQQVSRGQLIGYMGSTGWSTGPHLHFTIYLNGNTVDPMGYIG